MGNRALAFVLLIALSGCRERDTGGDGATGLVGLYEGGQGQRRNHMCLIERDGATRFGLVTWAGEGNTSCTGRGRATREGDRLALALQGDDSCIVEARIEGSRITLPASLPPGCAYYCGPEARMAGSTFDKTGDDAGRAVDLVGDPLCG